MSAPEQFAVTVEVRTVTWAKPDGSWVIAKVQLDREQPDPDNIPEWLRPSVSVLSDTVTMCGALGKGVGRGDLFDAVVKVESNPKYGRQLKAIMVERCVANTDRAIQSYLRGFPQIGRQRAQAICKHFGGYEGVLALFATDPQRLTEIEGITPARATEIVEAYHRTVGRRDAMVFAMAHKLPQWIVARVMDHFGSRARPTLMADPYALMDIRGVGFQQADVLAKRMDIADDDPRRTAAAAMHLLAAATNDGHVYSTVNHLLGHGLSRSVTKARRDIASISDDLIQAGYLVAAEPRVINDRYTRPPQVVLVADRIYPAYLHQAERSVQTKLGKMLGL